MSGLGEKYGSSRISLGGNCATFLISCKEFLEYPVPIKSADIAAIQLSECKFEPK
jgi:hypothetical protein